MKLRGTRRRTSIRCCHFACAFATVLVLAQASPLAEISVVVDPLRTAVNGADLIVHGTLSNVRRRDAFVRMSYPLGRRHFIDHYYDTGDLVVDKVIWGIMPSNPVPICFLSGHDSSSDPRTHTRAKEKWPRYSSGDRGLWMLERPVSTLPYCNVLIDSYHMIRDNDPQYERALQLVAERQKVSGTSP